MAETLYRKYRPQKFADVSGQTGIIQTLKNQVALGHLGHAYLFSGMRGTGKTTTARLLAKAANCHNRSASDFEPCGICTSCVETTAGRSVDVIELDAATHTGVDNVREQIVENARFMPTRDKFKIFIIDEVHMLSTSAFNALLKSLEEPPAHVIYVLATTELHKIPATVASRCQRFVFRPLAAAIMAERLKEIARAENMEVADEVIHRVLVSAGGAMRDAESLLGQLFALGENKITAQTANLVLPPTYFTEAGEFLVLIGMEKSGDAFLQLESLLARGVDMQLFHDTILRRAHEILLTAVTNSIPSHLGIFSENESAALHTWATQLSAAKLAQIIESLLEKRALYKTLSSPLMPLHLVVVNCTTAFAAAEHAPPSPLPTVLSPKTAATNFSLEEISAKWPQCLQTIIAAAPSLSMVLSGLQIKEVREQNVILTVPFPLHQAKLSEARTKSLIEQKITECFGDNLFYLVELEENEPEKPTITDPAIRDALATFGGEVVE